MVGQLDLFAGKRRRRRKPKPALEFALHCMIADDCKRFLNPAWRYTHLPLGEHRDHRIDKYGRRWSPAGARLKRMGVVAGFPDFLFVGPNRSVFWLELKRRGGRMSEAQADIFAHITACGFPFLMTDTYEDARDTLIDLGILRGIVRGA